MVRTWNIVALVLVIGFTFSSVSYAQEEKKTFGEKLSSATETAGRAIEHGKAVYDGKETGKEALLNFTTEESPFVAFLRSHDLSDVLGKTPGGIVSLLAFILIILIIKGRGKRKSGWNWLWSVPMFYIFGRFVILYTEYAYPDQMTTVCVISLITLLVEIVFCYKFWLALPSAIRDNGFIGGIKNAWVSDPDNPTTPPDESPTTDEDSGFSECPSCGKKMVRNGRCWDCGHKVEEADAPDTASSVTAGSTTATTSTPTPRPRFNRKPGLDVLD